MRRTVLGLSFAASIVFAPGSMAADLDTGAKLENRQTRITKLTVQIEKCNAELDRYRKTPGQPVVREHTIPMPACAPNLKQWLEQLAFYRQKNYRSGSTPGNEKNKSPCEIYGFICDPGPRVMDPHHE
jgi:hypothetical protein